MKSPIILEGEPFPWRGMKSPIILEGEPFSWNEPNPFGEPTEDNPRMWAAAAWADPGVIQCPKCSVYLWHEGLRIRCPDCGEEFDTRNKRWAEKGGANELIAALDHVVKRWCGTDEERALYWRGACQEMARERDEMRARVAALESELAAERAGADALAEALAEMARLVRYWAPKDGVPRASEADAMVIAHASRRGPGMP